MKVSELMIGDWVKVLPICHKVEPHYDRIESIKKEYTGQIYIEGGSHDRKHKGVRDWFDWSVGLDYITPIPLTAEILEKNAKSVEKDSCRTYYEFDDNFAIKEFSGVFFFCELENALSIGKGEINDNTWMRMDYVHELQHALRLVGLNEVADNLKV